jgi:hypothetical protein
VCIIEFMPDSLLDLPQRVVLKMVGGIKMCPGASRRKSVLRFSSNS